MVWHCTVYTLCSVCLWREKEIVRIHIRCLPWPLYVDHASLSRQSTIPIVWRREGWVSTVLHTTLNSQGCVVYVTKHTCEIIRYVNVQASRDESSPIVILRNRPAVSWLLVVFERTVRI